MLPLAATIRQLALRALSLFGVLITVLLLLVVSLGATGFPTTYCERR